MPFREKIHSFETKEPSRILLRRDADDDVIQKLNSQDLTRLDQSPRDTNVGRLGVASPLGWLCNNKTAEAEIAMAGLNTSLG